MERYTEVLARVDNGNKRWRGVSGRKGRARPLYLPTAAAPVFAAARDELLLLYYRSRERRQAH